MSCFLCKGKLEDRTSSFTVDLGNCIIIVKNVPSQVCSQCGETSYSDDVARQLEKIVNTIKSTMITEIAVVNYSDKVAQQYAVVGLQGYSRGNDGYAGNEDS